MIPPTATSASVSRDSAGALGVVEALSGVVRRALRDIEEYEAGLPHILVCIDQDTRGRSASGPFPSRAEAERVAAHERHRAGADATLVYEVEPLYPPLTVV